MKHTNIITVQFHWVFDTVMKDYNHFVVLAVGNNPQELMDKYDSNRKVEPHVVYKFKDAAILKKRYIDFLNALLDSGSVSSPDEKEEIKEDIEKTLKMDDIEFYIDYTEGYEYDKETGDAISDKNPNGKWTACNIGKIFSVPFITKDGKNSFSDIKGNLDWEKMHLYGTEIYEATWDVVMGGKTPETELELKVYENMKNRTGYFEKFGNKEKYVVSNTAFWCYGYVDKNGWVELEDGKDQFDWMINFYDRFVKPLPDNTKLTLFECRRD